MTDIQARIWARKFEREVNSRNKTRTELVADKKIKLESKVNSYKESVKLRSKIS